MRYRPLSGTRAVFALMLREMASTYGRSPGGYLWVVMEPVAGIALMSVVFSYLMRNPPLGSNFALFYATGYLPFTLYTTLTSRIGRSISYSRPLLAYPAVTYFDTVASRFLLVLLTELLVFILVIAGITTVYSLDLSPDYGRLLNGFLMAAVLGFGIGTLNAYLFGVLPVWEQIWSILNRPLFLISGVFLLVDNMPEPGRGILMWNPLAHFICEIRAGIYPTYEARYVDPVFVYLIGLVAATLGLLLLYRNARYLITEGA